MMKEKIFSITNFEFKGNIFEKNYDGVYVSYDGNDAVIGYGSKVQKARALFLLSMKVSQGKHCFEISEKPVFDTCGPMIDMSRGGVMRPEAVKRYIDCVAALGLNMLMLYTEDIYEVENYPMFGYLRGRYSLQELKEMDEYAACMGVELIPCIQTLGHLANYIKWGEASEFKENANVLLPDEDKTYEFIEAEIKAVRSCFRSNRIHLGMDEAVGLGLGEYLKKHGFEKKLNIFNCHLNKVLKIAEKYGYEPMIWGDMYFSSEDDNYYYEPDAIIPDYALKSAPDNVELVFWDYYHDDYDYYDKKLIQYERFPNTTSFGGGVWTWDGFVPNFVYTLKTMEPALRCCIDRGIKTVIATMWGNGGCETDYFKAFDGLAVFSEFCYKGSECSDDDIYAAAGCIIGADRAYIDAVSDFHLGLDGSAGVGKGLFYCDPLINLLCYDLNYEDVINTYQNAKDIIQKYSAQPSCDYYSLLFEIVSIKADIVLNLQREYKAKNDNYLLKTANETIPCLQKLYKEFYKVFSDNWHQNYKPFGFEVYAQRFGGIDIRLDYTADKLNAFVGGKIDTIEELDEKIADGLNKTWRYANSYMNTNL